MSETYNERVWRQSMYSHYRSKCKECGQDIIWMKTSNGRNMPVDTVRVTSNGSEMFVLFDKNGIIHRGPVKGMTGWRPHWQNCPKAEQFRKAKAGSFSGGEQ